MQLCLFDFLRYATRFNIFRWFKLASASFFILTMVTACKGTDPASTLSEEQKNIIKALVADDIAIGIDAGGSAILSPESGYIKTPLIFTTAAALQKDYEANEVNADLKYSDKTVVLIGTVTEISRGIGENYYISLRGGSNQFMPPRANMADGYRDFIAQLRKGDSIRLVCDGKTHMLIGSAVVENCLPEDAWVAATSQAIDSKILTSSADDKRANLFISFVVFLSKKLPENNACLTNDSEECMAALEEIPGFGSPEMQAEFKESQMKKNA
ncbi:MAG: OB-fold putative lipoprotein [Gammaproteobacteria bacterium]|nr:OB-fold putative lipoprotein [Gammaproteobacteria bacterium]